MVRGTLYDGAQAVAEIRGGALDTLYHTGVEIDEVLGRYAASGDRTLLQDALMSVIAQTNDAANAESFYAYSAYGEISVLGPDGGNSLRYTGREDDATGLYYYRARYYDSVLKRFLSEDPIGFDGGANLYVYVGGNPISFGDPFGLQIPPSQGSNIMKKILEIIGPREGGAAGSAGAEVAALPHGASMEQKGAAYGESLCKTGVRDYVTSCLEYCTSLITAGTGGPGAGGEIGACTAKCQSAYTKCKYPPQSSCPVPGML